MTPANLNLDLYAASVARAVKIPIREAKQRLKVVFDDPELLEALRDAAERIGPSSLVTNVTRVYETQVVLKSRSVGPTTMADEIHLSLVEGLEQTGKYRIEVSVTPIARSHEKSEKPTVLPTHADVVRHRIADWKKYGKATSVMRSEIAKFELERSRGRVSEGGAPRAFSTALPMMLGEYIDAWQFVEAPQ